MNAKMSELTRAFESAGFTDVKTVLSSGNVVFSASAASEASLQRKAEAAMRTRLGRAFLTIGRPIDELREMLASDPDGPFPLQPGSKRVVTFLRHTPGVTPRLPIDVEGARILSMNDRCIFSAYVRTPKGPVFMALIERTFGTEQTTRTWETVTKVAR